MKKILILLVVGLIFFASSCTKCDADGAGCLAIFGNTSASACNETDDAETCCTALDAAWELAGYDCTATYE